MKHARAKAAAVHWPIDLLMILSSALLAWAAVFPASGQIQHASDIVDRVDHASEVLARPLFSPNRRPAVAVAEPAPAPTDVVLTGVAITPERRVALIAVGTPRLTRRLTEGEAIEGRVVESILPDRVRLRRTDGRIETVFLRPVKAAAAQKKSVDASALPETEIGPSRRLARPQPSGH